MERKPIKIKNIEHLKELADGNAVEVFILLNFGLRSSKNLSYDRDTDKWNVYNYIDDTEQVLKTSELGVWTNIIKALDKGALYKY